VPSAVTFTARLVDDKSNKPVSGTHHIAFELFDAETGGASVWQEGRDIEIEDGLVFLDLGSVKPLDKTVFDGRRLFLAVTIDDAVMDPRIALDSVPYSIRAGTRAKPTASAG
jgi:hypothetical protein